MRTAAKLMVECLVTEGVKYIFGIPGEENLELVQAIADEPPALLSDGGVIRRAQRSWRMCMGDSPGRRACVSRRWDRARRIS